MLDLQMDILRKTGLAFGLKTGWEFTDILTRNILQCKMDYVKLKEKTEGIEIVIGFEWKTENNTRKYSNAFICISVNRNIVFIDTEIEVEDINTFSFIKIINKKLHLDIKEVF